MIILNSRWFAGALATLMLVGSAASLYAQTPTLAEVAKKEEERRKAQGDTGKVYTNKDLTAVPAPAAASSGDAAKPDSTSPAAKGANEAEKSKDADKGKDAAKEPVKDQAYWGSRLKELQAQLDRDQTFLDALQNRVNSLNADFVARDDPAQRATIARDRQKALDEMSHMKQTLQNDKKAIADLQEEARRSGVPPGWLR